MEIKRPLFVGVDVGGTNIKVGIVDDNGQSVADTRFPTQQELGPEHAIEQTVHAVERLFETTPFSRSDLVAGGLGTPGPMDIPTGTILTPTNLPGWHHFPVQQRFSDALGVPMAFINDAAAAAYGEYWVGAGKDHDSIVLITLGTGVGGGIIVDGISIDGANSHGAEIGHMVIDSTPTARVCGCGQKGHLEAYASATALVSRTHEALADDPSSVLNARITEASPLSALMVYNAAADGDPLANKIIEETAEYLGHGITLLAHVIDPSAFFLGGAMNFGGPTTPVGKKFLSTIIETVRKHSFEVIAERISVEFAQMGGEAGYIGAAGLGRRSYSQNK